jgi:hypothetical protein
MNFIFQLKYSKILKNLKLFSNFKRYKKIIYERMGSAGKIGISSAHP